MVIRSKCMPLVPFEGELYDEIAELKPYCPRCMKHCCKTASERERSQVSFISRSPLGGWCVVCTSLVMGQWSRKKREKKEMSRSAELPPAESPREVNPEEGSSVRVREVHPRDKVRQLQASYCPAEYQAGV
jgi:hypothetical protein